MAEDAKTPKPPAAGKAMQFATPLALPEDLVVLQKVRGPRGVHPHLGAMIEGKVGSTTLDVAAGLVVGDDPEFAPYDEESKKRLAAYIAKQHKD